MSYCMDPGESVEESIKRIALEQINQAIAEMRDPKIDLPDTVHQVRKRCKKIRAIIRLVQPQFEKTYQLENAWYRDAARELSHARDAEVLAQTHDKLMSYDQRGREDYLPIREWLVRCRQGISDNPRKMEKCLQGVARRMKSGSKRVPFWSLDGGSDAAFSGGLKKTYKRGRKALNKAFTAPTDESFHEWRKQVKYHWYHARILRPLRQDDLQRRCDDAKLLADLLGEEHDLGVLRRTLASSPSTLGNSLGLEKYFQLIEQRRAELRVQAEAVGRRVFSEKAKNLAKRIQGFWGVWTSEHRRHAVSDHPGVKRMSA